MRWSMSCLIALALAAGCSTYGTSKDPDAGVDAAPDAGPDGSTDAGSDADAGGDAPGDLGACTAEQPQRVSLEIGDCMWDCGYAELVGDAQVVYNPPPAPGTHWSDVWVWFEEQGHLQELRVGLPEGYAPPLRLGERMWARTTVDTPWWVNTTLELRPGGPDAGRRLSVVDTSMTWPDYQSDCEPVPDAMGCGQLVYPETVASFRPELPDVDLHQGTSEYLSAPDRTLAYQIFVGSMHEYTQMDCYDVPMGWLSYASLDMTHFSQCTCRDDTQCALAEVCDTTAGRCVLDRCQIGFACAPGEVCDPYRGLCVPEPITPCANDGDCDEMQICNTHTGDCVEDVCMLMDCMGQCSSLLASCYGCLSDCECWPGVCDPIAHTCDPACQADKIDFSQDNPDGDVLFIVCLDERMEQAAELLGQYVGPVQCQVDVPAGTCDPGVEQACVGEIQFDPNARVDSAQWTGLCALTRLPVITRIRGIYDWP